MHTQPECNKWPWIRLLSTLHLSWMRILEIIVLPKTFDWDELSADIFFAKKEEKNHNKFESSATNSHCTALHVDWQLPNTTRTSILVILHLSIHWTLNSKNTCILYGCIAMDDGGMNALALRAKRPTTTKKHQTKRIKFVDSCGFLQLNPLINWPVNNSLFFTQSETKRRNKMKLTLEQREQKKTAINLKE